MMEAVSLVVNGIMSSSCGGPSWQGQHFDMVRQTRLDACTSNHSRMQFITQVNSHILCHQESQADKLYKTCKTGTIAIDPNMHVRDVQLHPATDRWQL